MKKRNANKIGSQALAVVRKFAPNVNSVTDADDDLIVSVTEKDFKNGKKKDHNECALAVATKRQEHAASVIVSASTAYVVKGDRATRYHLPMSAQKEVVSFDRGADFCAGDYKLKAVPKSNRLGARREREARIGHHTGGYEYTRGGAAKRFVHHTADIRDSLKTKA